MPPMSNMRSGNNDVQEISKSRFELALVALWLARHRNTSDLRNFFKNSNMDRCYPCKYHNESTPSCGQWVTQGTSMHPPPPPSSLVVTL